MSPSNISRVTLSITLMQPPHVIFTRTQFMQITGQQSIHPSANSPRPSTPLTNPPPPYSVSSFEQERWRRNDPGRWILALRSYLLIVTLLLATLTVVNLYTLLPPALSNILYSVQHWIYSASAIIMALSLIVLSIRQYSGLSSTVLNNCWIILLWGSSTVNVIMMERRYTLNAVHLAGCLTLVASVGLTLFALQLQADLTRDDFKSLMRMCGCTAFILAISVLQGTMDTRTAASAAWIAALILILPVMAQFVVGGRKLELPKEDFILAEAILLTLVTNAFQHILFFFSN